MTAVFVSSIQAGFEPERAAARAAIESLSMRPLMAEIRGAADASPRRALLDLVAAADLVILIVGPRYSGPTEDEYDEAVRLGKSVFVLVQSTEREPEAQAFLERITSGWSAGRLYEQFATPHELSLAIVRCLQQHADRPLQAAALAVAEERARALAASASNDRSHSEHDIAVVAVPATGGSMLTAVDLVPALGDRIAVEARAAGLATQADGLDVQVNAAGVAIALRSHRGAQEPVVEVHSDGAIVAMVSARGEGMFAGSVIDPDHLADGIRRGAAFAKSVWKQIDSRAEVDYVLTTLAVQNAAQRSFGKAPSGNSISMGGFMRLPSTVVAPDPPERVRAGLLGGDKHVEHLIAALRLVYADAGALV